MKYRHIVWDWNGTLLNDGHASAEAVDRMLKRRNLGTLSMEDYREKITYPVIQLYYDSGFDFLKEKYEDMCEEFISNYKSNRHMIALHEEVREVLSYFRTKNVKQHIVSASESGILAQQIEEYGLTEYFDSISGLKDHRADSKTHLAERLIKEIGCDPSDFLFIGDTLHDYEIARSLGAGCCLVSNGHCSTERLSKTLAPVFTNLGKLLDSFNDDFQVLE